MEEKKSTILFIMDICRLENIDLFNIDHDYFYKNINNKKAIENADDITIVLTDFRRNNSSRGLLLDYATKLKNLLNYEVNFYIYPFTPADNNIDISNVTSHQMQYIDNRHKYSFIYDTIQKVSKKYNVVYTALMQGIDMFDVDEEFQAREYIETINKICKFDLLFNSRVVNDFQGIYNDHLVVSGIAGLDGYLNALKTKMEIDKGVVPNMRYYEFYSKNGKQNNNDISIQKNAGDMLIIVDVSRLKECNYITNELSKIINEKKDEVGANNLYIVISNKTSNSHTKEDLEKIARELKWSLNEEAKVFTKVNKYEGNYQTEFINSANYGFLKDALEIRDMFSKKYNISLIHTLYFTHFNNYKRITNEVKQRMSNSNIEFLAHSAENNIEGIICSKEEGFMSLADCIKLSMNENTYVDNKNQTIANNEEITVFYCDIAGTIDHIVFDGDMIKILNDKLMQLKQTHSSNKISLCLMTNDSNFNYLSDFVSELKDKLDSNIIFTDHFYANGLLTDGELIQEEGSIGYNKFKKIQYHLYKLINLGYKINYAYFADDNMADYDIHNFNEYLPNNISGRLLIPGDNYCDITNEIVTTDSINIYGVINCIDKSIELEKSEEKGVSYSKKYISKKVEEDDDDDELPF